MRVCCRRCCCSRLVLLLLLLNFVVVFMCVLAFVACIGVSVYVVAFVVDDGFAVSVALVFC